MSARRAVVIIGGGGHARGSSELVVAHLEDGDDHHLVLVWEPQPTRVTLAGKPRFGQACHMEAGFLPLDLPTSALSDVHLQLHAAQVLGSRENSGAAAAATVWPGSTARG